MPSQEEMKKRQEARLLRKQRQEENIENSHTEAVKLAALSQEQAAAKNAAAARTASEPPKKPAPQPTGTQRRAAAQQKRAREKATAEARAEKDANLTPAEPDFAVLEAEMAEGASLSLHQLNIIAERQQREARDEGKDIAAAAAKGAYETYIGKVAGKRSRHAHMRAQQAAGEAKIREQQARQEQQA